MDAKSRNESLYDSIFRYFICGDFINDEGSYYFFRGQSNSKEQYYLVPSIFRENISEHGLFEEIMRKHPLEFTGMKPIEILCKMQHMGIPTRLLDITKNSFVGLFFAVSSLSKNEPTFKSKINPEVVIFAVDKGSNMLKGINSDKIKILSSIPLLKDKLRKKLLIDAVNDLLVYKLAIYVNYRLMLVEPRMGLDKRFIVFFKRFILQRIAILNGHDGKNMLYEDELGSKKYNDIDIKLVFGNNDEAVECSIRFFGKELNISIPVLYSSLGGIVISSLFEVDFLIFKEKYQEMLEEDFIKELSNCTMCMNDDGVYFSYAMEQLYYQIKSYYSDFRRGTSTLDLLNGSFVSPIVNTDRMRAQQGVFAIYGLSKYWNIILLVEFLRQRKVSDADIVKIMIEDKDIPSEIDLLQLENKLFNIRRKQVPIVEVTSIRKMLENIGINKEMLGCGMDSTYYSYYQNSNEF